MPRRYSGTPLDSEWGKLKRRRELAQAITAQSLEPYSGTQTVTGHAVDDRWGQGLGKIGTAIIGAMANKRVDDESKELNKEFDTGRQRALDKVIGALQGTPTPYDLSPDEQFDNEQIPGLKNAAQKPDMMKAAIGMTDPYLQGDDVARAMINSQTLGGGRGGYSKTFEGEDGRMYSMDMRDPNAQPRLLSGEGGEPLYSPKYTPRALYGQNRAKQLGTGGAELETDPATASAVEAAKQGRLGAPPQTQAQEAADKAQAESAQARAFNMEGAQDLVTRANDILSGEGLNKPTGSFIGNSLDFMGNIVGLDVPGSVEAERLRTIGAAMTAKVPRFEGPQGVYDVSLYEKMAGSVGNANISTVKRKAAVEEFKRAFAKYEEVEPGVFVDKTKPSSGGLTPEEEAELEALEAEVGAP